MERITQSQLEGFCDYLNRLTGNPEKQYTRDSEGKLRANIGNYHISYAYGGVSLHQMCNEAGGITSVLSIGHVPKRELYNLMQAYARGIEQTLERAK